MSQSPYSPEVMTLIHTMNDYNDWDHEIFRAAERFQERFRVWPNILLGNRETLHAFDLFMSKKLLAEGKVSAVVSLGMFSCSRFELQICLGEELPDHSFTLIYDNEAEFVDEPETLEQEQEKSPPPVS